MSIEEIECKLAQDHQIFLQGHIDEISAILITSDNKYIISASRDSTIRIWFFEDSSQVAVLKGHAMDILSLAITNDNKFIISGSMDTTIIIWSLPDRKQVSVLHGHTRPVYSVRLTSDNKYIISTGSDWYIRIWDFQERIQVQELLCPLFERRNRFPLMIVMISKDDKCILCSFGTETIIYNFPETEHKSTFRLHLKDDGLCIWNIPEQEKEANLIERSVRNKYKCTRIALTADNQFIISGNTEGSIIIWNRQDVKNYYVLQGHFETITHLVLTSDNNYLISGSAEIIIIWDFHTKAEFYKLTLSAVLDKCLELTVNENCIIYTLVDRTTTIWNIRDKKESPVLRREMGDIRTIAINSDHIVLGLHNNKLRVWNIKEDTVKILPGHTSKITSIVMTRDNKYIVSRSFDSTMRIWDVKQTRESSLLFRHKANISLSITNQDKYFVSASSNCSFMVWKFEKENKNRQSDRLQENLPNMKRKK